MPKRIQRKRTKGWRMPSGAIYVGRPTKWGNPSLFVPHSSDDVSERISAVEAFREYASEKSLANPDWLLPLRGYDLVCWCPLEQPCHADVLLELANEEKQVEYE